ncbi:MAG: alpha/beta hydrolase [Bacteroidetes bacterium HGW-Bacteroidetes-23]|nr:MAG: alpha/beta hydrolase [Bacteroidetes bacterium HGW-Bacteroidetes-23]
MNKIIILLVLSLFLKGCNTTKDTKIDDYVFKRKQEKSKYIKAYNETLKLWKIPFQEENIITSYGTAHIIISGPKNAEPLVLLHGMDASSTMWYPNIKALSKNHRVYAIDFLMEPGKSVSCGETISKEETIAWYNEIFKHYNLKKIKIVGASRGGWLATLLATQENSNISKMVLLSPAQTLENLDKMHKASSALMLKLFPNKKKLENTLNAFAFYSEKIDPIYMNQFFLANKFAKTNMSFIQMQPFSKEEIEKITIPVLIMIGDHDIVNSEKSLEKGKELLPKGEMITIENAGHFLTIDQPEVVNQKMIEFLEK